MKALGELHEFAEKDPETPEEIHAHLGAIKQRYGFTRLEPTWRDGYWSVDATLNPTTGQKPIAIRGVPATKLKAHEDLKREVDAFVAGGGSITKITKPVHEHHIATDKTPKYRVKFEAIFAGAGMKLQDPANLISIEGHEGAHGPNYHEPVLKRLTEAVQGVPSGTQKYKDELCKALYELKLVLMKPDSYLGRLIRNQ
jgi:hypothetical protein